MTTMTAPVPVTTTAARLHAMGLLTDAGVSPAPASRLIDFVARLLPDTDAIINCVGTVVDVDVAERVARALADGTQ